MSTPYFLDSAQIARANAQDDGVTDVNTIISSIRTLLVTTLGWSEPSTALFKTPVDAASRFLDVLLTRISATNLEIRVRNAAAATVITRRIQITSGVSVWYYGSVYGVVIEAMSATAEVAQAHVLDQTPDLQTDSSLYVIANAYRSAADATDANAITTGFYFAIDNGAAGQLSRLRRWTANSGNDAGSSSKTLVTHVGTMLWKDPLVAINSAGTLRWAGRICHALMCDSSIPVYGRRYPFIDTDTTKEFRVLSLTASASNMRLAFRSAA